VSAITNKALAVWWKDLKRWVVSTDLLTLAILPDDWSLVRIGDLVAQVSDRVVVEPNTEYKMVGVRWYGEGTFHRETVKGSSLSAKYVTPVIPEALIYNRLFAWKASFAVVPEEHEGHFVSNEFPQFKVNKERILPQYLYLFLMVEKNIRVIKASSIGSSAVSRNRFKEEEFLEFEIPLPPLSTQRAIINQWHKVLEEHRATAERLNESERRLKEAFLSSLGIETQNPTGPLKCFAISWHRLERWSVEYLKRMVRGQNKLDTGLYPTEPLSLLCVGQSGGTPPKKQQRFWNGNIPWVSPKDMKRHEIYGTQDYITEEAIKDSSAPLIKPNSVLIVTRSGILQRKVPIATNKVSVSINQDMRAFTLTGDKLLPEFLAFYLESKQNDLLKLVKWSTTVQSINKEELESFPIPIPPLEVQQTLMAHIQDRKAEIASEREAIKGKTNEAKAILEALILGSKTLQVEL
jgi:type I restriction enzyme, S subunit